MTGPLREGDMYRSARIEADGKHVKLVLTVDGVIEKDNSNPARQRGELLGTLKESQVVIDGANLLDRPDMQGRAEANKFYIVRELRE
jgi:hypothetical protein